MLTINKLKELSSQQLLDLKLEVENKIYEKQIKAESYYNTNLDPINKNISLKYKKIASLRDRIDTKYSIYNSENRNWHTKYYDFGDYSSRISKFIVFSFYIVVLIGVLIIG